MTTPLIGRDAEIDHITRTLNDPACQLLTLIGMGGMGKSRVAGQIFHSMKNLPDGAVWVSLETTTTADDIVATITRHPHFEGVVTSPRALLSYLADKHMLIILDQYEHLLPHTDWLPPFLTGCAGITWLVTSQVALNLSMEWQIHLAPLSSDGEANASMELFAYHAGRMGRGDVMQTDKQAVLDICQHLEGHPLAIQLVCRWLQSLSPHDIFARLNTFELLESRYADIPPRQRNLWAVLRQLWDLLPPDAGHLLSQLAFFDGDFSLEAILACCDAPLPLIDDLIGRSLLISQNGRYRLHSLIRQFVRSHAPPHADFIHAYIGYFLALMTKHGAGIRDGRYRATQRVFDTEYANLRNAWHVAVSAGDNDALIMPSLHDFFLYAHTRGRTTDFTQWLIFAQDHIRAHSPLWVMVTFIQLYMAMTKGIPTSKEHLADCIYHARKNQLTALLPHLTRLKGDLLMNRHLIAKARPFFDEAQAEFIAQNDLFEVARTTNRLGVVHLYLGDLPRAEHYFRQSLMLKQENQIYIEWVGTLNNLAEVMILNANLSESKRLIAQMYTISDDIAFFTGRMQAHQLDCLIACLEGNLALADDHQAHIRAKLAVAQAGIVQFNNTLMGYICLLHNSPTQALIHLQTTHNLPPLDRFWRTWAMGLAYWQLGQVTGIHEQLRSMIHVVRSLNNELFTFMLLWLLAQVDGDKALVAELATHPISQWGLFRGDTTPHAVANMPMGWLRTRLERLAIRFESVPITTQETIPPLSDRETEILTLVAQELSNQDIAQACHLTVGTVKVHLHRIYQKLGVENRIQAVRVAHANRLLPLV